MPLGSLLPGPSLLLNFSLPPLTLPGPHPLSSMVPAAAGWSGRARFERISSLLSTFLLFYFQWNPEKLPSHQCASRVPFCRGLRRSKKIVQTLSGLLSWFHFIDVRGKARQRDFHRYSECFQSFSKFPAFLKSPLIKRIGHLATGRML